MQVLAVKVQKRFGERVRSMLYEHGLLNRTYHIRITNEHLEMPLNSRPPEMVLDDLSQYGIEIITMVDPEPRALHLEPFEVIEARVDIPEHLKKLIPKKWELLGDVLVLKFHADLQEYKHSLGGIYAEVLGAKTVLEERSGITGITRKPDMELLYGSITETTHTENGIKYSLNASELMFSSGNISERLRMAEIDCSGETIVDMFCGIGYFTLPLAVYGNPRKIVSCEINPLSFDYLNRNVKANGVSDIVEPVLGDCRDTAPADTADRLIMGMIKNTAGFLPKAMKVLKKDGGVIHYHDTCPDKNIPNRPLDQIKKAAEDAGFKAEMENIIKIKSYAPGIYHLVIDARIFR